MLTNRGYTGHEQVDEVDLIHMNGRMYDATLGCFVSADTFILAPNNSQSFNRYSYVLNNPMKYTDPSGHFFKKLFKEIGRFMDKYAVAIVQIVLIALATAANPMAGVAMATMFGYARGGFRGAMTAFLTSLMFIGIGNTFTNISSAIGYTAKTLVHGIAGGVSSVMSGGKFGDGFWSAAVTQAFAPDISSMIPGESGLAMFGRVSIAAVIGGTGSRLSGGKFENGAVTGAFSRLFNDEIHRGQKDATNSAQSQGNNPLSVVGDVIGKIWALPNTIIGAIYGGVDHIVGEVGYVFGLYDVSPSITFGNNAIQFIDNPFTLSKTAITLGNTISYGRGTGPSQYGSYGDYSVQIGLHEKAHTYQYQALGPLFLPTYFIGGGISGPSGNPFENAAQNYGRGNGGWWPW